MQTSKSPNAVARVAYRVAKQTVPAYRHEFSPKKFTQHQLIACLVLKEFFTTDYRGITAILDDSTDLRQILELPAVPHFTTLQKAAQRFTRKNLVDKLLREILMIAIQEKILSPRSKHAGIDGTGFESHHISNYFVKRKAKGQDVYQMTTYTRYPKAGLVVDSNSHLVWAGIPTRGPGPDITHYEAALTAATKNISIALVTADAGYDSEHSHVFARARGIRTIIPPLIGRRTDQLPRGYWRKIMATRFNKQLYGQRWQAETVNSMIKRNLGSALRARSYWSQCREVMLRLLTHNIMIVLPAL